MQKANCVNNCEMVHGEDNCSRADTDVHAYVVKDLGSQRETIYTNLFEFKRPDSDDDEVVSLWEHCRDLRNPVLNPSPLCILRCKKSLDLQFDADVEW